MLLYCCVLHLAAGAPGSARAAILNFLAAAEPGELRPLLELFLAPLGAAFVQPEGEQQQRQQPQAKGDLESHRCEGREGRLRSPDDNSIALCRS